MVTSEAPQSDEALYDDRGHVPPTRPITQGDVFREVDVPGFTDQPAAVLVLQHPCSMRAGAELRPRLTVVAIRGPQRIRPSDWQGYAWAMLLPNLLGDGSGYLADFRDVISVDSSLLLRSKRIAALTNYGVQVLHQRNIFYQTRLMVDISTLAQTFDPIATELELQYEWVEAAVAAAVDTSGEAQVLEVIAAAEREFNQYLDEKDRARRKSLQQPLLRADVRRQVRREIAKRY